MHNHASQSIVVVGQSGEGVRYARRRFVIFFQTILALFGDPVRGVHADRGLDLKIQIPSVAESGGNWSTLAPDCDDTTRPLRARESFSPTTSYSCKSIVDRRPGQYRGQATGTICAGDGYVVLLEVNVPGVSMMLPISSSEGSRSCC